MQRCGVRVAGTAKALSPVGGPAREGRRSGGRGEMRGRKKQRERDKTGGGKKLRETVTVGPCALPSGYACETSPVTPLIACVLVRFQVPQARCGDGRGWGRPVRRPGWGAPCGWRCEPGVPRIFSSSAWNPDRLQWAPAGVSGERSRASRSRVETRGPSIHVSTVIILWAHWGPRERDWFVIPPAVLARVLSIVRLFCVCCIHSSGFA